MVGRGSLKKKLVMFSGKKKSFSETENTQSIVKLQLVTLTVEKMLSSPKFIYFGLYECTHLLSSHSRMPN